MQYISSIEGIHNSNHTLEELDFPDWSRGFDHFWSPFVKKDCFRLDKETNKDQVIHTKIALYYFRGEFDISPFVNMNVKLLPKVMAMIEDDAISRRVMQSIVC